MRPVARPLSTIANGSNAASWPMRSVDGTLKTRARP
jgi:hypothetical protein